jgi:hypothetical protein
VVLIMRLWTAIEGVFKLLIILVIISIIGVGVLAGLFSALVHAAIAILNAVPDIVRAGVDQLHNLNSGGGGGTPPPTT